MVITRQKGVGEGKLGKGGQTYGNGRKLVFGDEHAIENIDI